MQKRPVCTEVEGALSDATLTLTSSCHETPYRLGPYRRATLPGPPLPTPLGRSSPHIRKKNLPTGPPSTRKKENNPKQPPHKNDLFPIKTQPSGPSKSTPSATALQTPLDLHPKKSPSLPDLDSTRSRPLDVHPSKNQFRSPYL